MQAIRSIVFDILAYVLTFAYMTLMLPFVIIFPRMFCQKLYKNWVKTFLKLMDWCVGLSFKVEGQDILERALKNGPCIIASKHQSAWDTVIFALFVNRFTIVLKKELIKVPIFGLYLKKLGCISIDRNQGIKSIKHLINKGKESVKKDLSILIFPEGTRVSPGENIAYNPGIAALYQSTNVPVIPVALNSGLFWKRRSKIKQPGVITIKFLNPINPGLEKRDFLAKLQHVINTESQSLIDNAVNM